MGQKVEKIVLVESEGLGLLIRALPFFCSAVVLLTLAGVFEVRVVLFWFLGAL